jgi:tetratricopeptide (TPR) repeat protein
MSFELPARMGTGARQKAVIGLIAEGKLEEALEVMDPRMRGNADLNHLLGQVALQKRDYHGALNYLRKADFATPGDMTIRADIATVFYYSGKKTAAKMLLNQLLGDAHPPAQASFVMGLVLMDEGNFSGSEEALRRCVRMNEQHGEACFELGVLLLETDKVEDAYHFCARSLELLPHDAAAYTNAGLAALRLGRYALCEQHLRRGLSLDAGGVRSRFYLGLCLIERGQEHEGMLLFRELIDHEPSLYGEAVKEVSRAGRGCLSINPLRTRQKFYTQVS